MHSSTGRSIQIADLVASFRDGKHPDSGVDAWWCWLCKKWLVGNVSDLLHTYPQVAMHDLKTWNQHLITDFRHWSTHKAKYLAGCQSEQVEPNKCIMCYALTMCASWLEIFRMLQQLALSAVLNRQLDVILEQRSWHQVAVCMSGTGSMWWCKSRVFHLDRLDCVDRLSATEGSDTSS